MKTMPKCRLRIYSVVTNVSGFSVDRWLVIVGLAISVAISVSTATAAENSRVPRVPDTWQTAASDDSIYFGIGSSSIGDAAAQTMQRHMVKLKAAPQLHVTVIAHTNDLGSSSLELAKGQERLDVVRKRLEESRISPGRINTENQGSENRSGSLCADEECRRNNRRVDFLFHR